MNHKIRFGIIGCSSIAERTTIPAIKEVKNTELKIIGSRNPKKAKNFAKKFSCSLYGNYDDVLENKEVDVVYISLPPSLNEKWVIKAANSGKHIICEKPAAISYKSAKKMVLECKKNNVRILEGFSFRFHTQHTKVLKTVESKLGKIFSFSGSYGFNLTYSSKNFRLNKELGGGVLNDVGCYLICASRTIFKNQPISILCNLYTNKKYGVDIKGSAYIVFPQKSIAQISFSYDDFFQSTYSIWSNSGILNLKRAFNARKDMSVQMELQTHASIKKIKLKPVNQSKLMISEFCRELEYPNSAAFNFEKDLIDQAKLMEAARRSNLTKKIIFMNKI